MPNDSTSILFGSYVERFPGVVSEGVNIDPKLFAPGFSLPLRTFVEPDEAKKLRLSTWASFIDVERVQNHRWVPGEVNGLPALMEAQQGRWVPVRFANPLYTQDDPTNPKCFFATDWTYFQVSNNPEYFDILKKSGVQPPLMAGMHLESPRIGLEQRPTGKMGRPGEAHPPSCAMRQPSHHFSLSQFLLTPKRLSQLGFADFPSAIAACERIVIRQIHAYNPEKQQERPHLADLCLVWEGGIPNQLPLTA